MNKKRLAMVVAVISIAIGFLAGVYIGKKGIPFVGNESTLWAIGIYAGSSPYNLDPQEDIRNPVLRAQDVSDIEATFVADPFMTYKDGIWYLFFEVFNARTRQGDIAYATSTDGYNWAYKQLVLDESFHLSYPQVFEWEGSYYMVPETNKANAVKLYKAEVFPTKWKLAKNLLEDVAYSDPTIFRYQDKWWLFVTKPYPNSHSLYVYKSDDLFGPWLPHTKNPVIDDIRRARPAGRVIQHDGKLYRFAQNLESGYGLNVNAFEIKQLTETDYAEEAVKDNPVVGRTGKGWNARGMHHVDAHKLEEGNWIAVVDGKGTKRVFGLKY